MAEKESKVRTIGVALAVCLVCSIGVSTAAVMLKPLQEKNRLNDRRQNILSVVGLWQPGVDVNKAFEQVETRIIDLASGEFATDVDIDPAQYDMYAASDDPSMAIDIPKSEDIAGIGSKPKYATVYLVRDDAGGIKNIVLPVHGYGLWGTLYGFLALGSDAQEIAGLSFYEHKETPGLGGEVDNPKWKAQWQGKQAYEADGDVAIRVIKGKVEPNTPNAESKIDGLSGATLTSRGVSKLVQYWLSEAGYKPFLNRLTRKS